VRALEVIVAARYGGAFTSALARRVHRCRARRVPDEFIRFVAARVRAEFRLTLISIMIVAARATRHRGTAPQVNFFTSEGG